MEPRGLKVLIADGVAEVLLRGLTEAGYDVLYRPNWTQLEVEAYLPQCSGLVLNSKIRVSAQMLASAPALRFVARLGSGLEGIDVGAARLHSVAVYHSPEGNCDAVAEHALGMMLSLLNHLGRADRELRAGIWRREANRGRALGPRVVGLLGLGHTGRALAWRLRALGLRVMAYDPYVHREDLGDLGAILCPRLEDLYEEVEILSLHLPLTVETSALVSADFLARFKRPLLLINTSRGGVVVLRDLTEALLSGRVVGAGLDVFEDEHPGTYAETASLYYAGLFEMEQVILTPHVAGWTEESKVALSEVLLEKILGRREATLPSWIWKFV